MRFHHCSINAIAALLLLSIKATSLARPPDPNPQHVYWGAWQIHRANLDGTGVTQVADPGGPYGSFLVNRAAGLLYIVDGYHLRSTNLDGTNEQTIYTFPGDFYNPDVALDASRNQLYVNDEVQGAIYRVAANGQNPLQIIPPQTGPGGTRHIEEIDFDPIQDKLYWTQWPSGSGMQFRRSDPNGTGIENLFSVNANVSDFALDIDAGKVYWTQFGSVAGQGSVHRANLNGTSHQTLVSGLWGVAGIALDIPRNKLYFSDHWTAGPTNYDGKIYTANLDGSNLQVLVNLGPADSAKPYYVVLDPLLVPEPASIILAFVATMILTVPRRSLRTRPEFIQKHAHDVQILDV
jgi:hypothetical protein